MGFALLRVWRLGLEWHLCSLWHHGCRCGGLRAVRRGGVCACRVRAQLDQAQACIAVLEADNKRLVEDLDRAQQRLEGARRAGKRQTAPFCRDAKKADPKRPGHKAGEDYGVRAPRAVPGEDEIDEIIVVDLPEACACGRDVALPRDGVEMKSRFDRVITRVPARRCQRRWTRRRSRCPAWVRVAHTVRNSMM